MTHAHVTSDVFFGFPLDVIQNLSRQVGKVSTLNGVIFAGQFESLGPPNPSYHIKRILRGTFY